MPCSAKAAARTSTSRRSAGGDDSGRRLGDLSNHPHRCFGEEARARGRGPVTRRQRHPRPPDLLPRHHEAQLRGSTARRGYSNPGEPSSQPPPPLEVQPRGGGVNGEIRIREWAVEQVVGDDARAGPRLVECEDRIEVLGRKGVLAPGAVSSGPGVKNSIQSSRRLMGAG